MKKTMKNLLVISMVTLGLSATGTAFAKGPRQMRGEDMGQRGGGLRQLAGELNLTAEQKQQIMTIVTKFRLDRMGDRQDFQPPYQEMIETLLNEDFDEAKVREMVQQQMAEREQEREDRFVERAKMISEIKAVLTPEQLEQAKELGTDFFQGGRRDAQTPDAQQDARGKGHRQERGEKRGQAQNKQDKQGNLPGKGQNGDRRGGFAQGGGLPFMMLADLDLSEEQKQQAAEIFAASQVKRLELRQEFQASGKPLMDTLLNEEFDEQKIRELYQQQVNAGQNPAQLLEERIVGQAKMLAELKAMLTPEQLDTLKKNVADWTENAGKRGGKFGPKPHMKGGWF